MSKGMLYLVGLGLGSEGFLTLRARSILEASDRVFLESYTSVLDPGLLRRLKTLRPDLRLLKREDCELKDYQEILEALDQGFTVAFLVPGDPMLATTHVNLVLEARKRGHRVEIVPGVSIFSSAFSLSGLQIYKLGCIVTFPLDYSRTPSVARKILEAYSNGRHSLVLFYYDSEQGLGPEPPELARFLLNHGLPGSAWIVVLERLGFPDQRVVSSRIQALADSRQRFKHPVTAVIPGNSLHPIEEEYLKSLESGVE